MVMQDTNYSGFLAEKLEKQIKVKSKQMFAYERTMQKSINIS